jgi:hypothetical protein
MEIIVGAVVSLIAQVVKKYFGTNEYTTLAVVLGLAIVGAFAYSVLVSVGYWENFLLVLTSAGAFYTFIIERFKS